MAHQFQRVRAQIGPDYCAVCDEDQRHSNHLPALVYSPASEPKTEILRQAARDAGLTIIEVSIVTEGWDA